jgi:hypothetical protein
VLLLFLRTGNNNNGAAARVTTKLFPRIIAGVSTLARDLYTSQAYIMRRRILFLLFLLTIYRSTTTRLSFVFLLLKKKIKNKNKHRDGRTLFILKCREHSWPWSHVHWRPQRHLVEEEEWTTI